MRRFFFLKKFLKNVEKKWEKLYLDLQKRHVTRLLNSKYYLRSWKPFNLTMQLHFLFFIFHPWMKVEKNTNTPFHTRHILIKQAWKSISERWPRKTANLMKQRKLGIENQLYVRSQQQTPKVNQLFRSRKLNLIGQKQPTKYRWLLSDRFDLDFN